MFILLLKFSKIFTLLLFNQFIFINCGLSSHTTAASLFAKTSPPTHVLLNYSKLEPTVFETLSLNILDMLHLKLLANVFNQSDERVLMFLLSEMVKRWKKINEQERTVYWLSRQG
jgi:hypothetical protein